MRISSLIVLLLAPFLIFSQQFTLESFYSSNQELSESVDSIYNLITERQRIGQMIVTSYGINGRPSDVVEKLVEAGDVGGVIYMKGTHADHLNNTFKLNRLNSGLPIMYSMDAEPSLLGGRITSLPKVLKTKDIASVTDNDSIAKLICNELNSIGVKLNYAPDCDLSTSNAAIGSRSYGAEQDTVVKMVNSFINTSSNHNVLTCAKHFPGHGLVEGDSHYGRVKISGEMKELGVYKELVKNPQLYSVMIGHINVENNDKYNTFGVPSSCSPVIIKELLKNELGFKGLVISDGLGMHALKSVGIPGFEASKAGCDVLCMPSDEVEVIDAILNETKTNVEYAKQIEVSVKKIIRMKLCLGLFTKPMKNEKVILYQHGRIIEEQGLNAVSPQFGKYEYKGIVDAFEQNGFKVIENVRGNNANANYHASRIVQQIDSLLLAGYLPQNITIVGGSKGAWISLLAASKLSSNKVNVVSLAICGTETDDYFNGNNIKVQGRWLSIFEASDNWGQSCNNLNKSKTTAFKELRINTGKQHGVVFKPLKDWIKPVVEWAGGEYIQPKIYVNDEIWLEHIQDSIFMHTSNHEADGFGDVQSNGLIIVKNGEAIIVDTPMDIDKTKVLVEYIEMKWNVKVTKHIPGHYHPDCTGGLKYLLDHGVESIANKKTVKLCKENDFPIPTKSFKDSTTINFNGLKLKLWFPGAGRTKDNIVVWIPNAKLLFGGCLIKSLEAKDLGFTGDAVLKDWDITVEKVKENYPGLQKVIPGHGKNGGLD